MNLNILYIDNHLLVINKPAGMLVQGDHTGRTTLLEEAKTWIKQEYDKPGNVFLGLVHRLDRQASGVVVFARTSKAASRLSGSFRNRAARKTYWAKVSGELPERGHWVDHLLREEYRSRVVEPELGKESSLGFVRIALESGISTVEIDLETGRHHQIRVQFSHRGFPILGDRKYGSKQAFEDDAIALHARQIEIVHPTLKEAMVFEAEPGDGW